MSALRMKSPVAPIAKPSGQHDHAVSSKCIGVNSRSRSSSVSEIPVFTVIIRESR